MLPAINEEEWILSLKQRRIWWGVKEYEWYYHILFKGVEQLVPLGMIPLALLIYYNSKIYSAIKRPPNIELQGEEEISAINREKRLSKVLIGLVCVFNVCHAPRILWYIINAYNYQSIVYCPLQNPSTSGQSSWIYVLGLLYDLFLVINSSVNVIVYCAINERFKYYFLVFLTSPYNRFVQYISPMSPSASPV